VRVIERAASSGSFRLPATLMRRTSLAQEVEIQINEAEWSVWTRILPAEHLVAICLRVGRPRHLIRITQFLEEDAVDLSALSEILRRPHLKEVWQAFCSRTGIADP
jgi:hypothetical protein